MSSSPRPSRGITLVELLVTASIIAILGSVILFSLTASQEAAREAKTKALIATLHGLLMERYESYQTRRVPVDTSSDPPNVAAAKRLAGIRRLMQLEMPERWTEINNPAITPLGNRPALSLAYQGRYTLAMAASNQRAESLYLVITMATGDGEARALFKESDIGDTDADGAREFVDGWGNPIAYLRWPAGFVSPLQTQDADIDHDPFDPMKVDQTVYQRSAEAAYRTVPMIFSAGPDGKYDIIVGDSSLNYDIDIPSPISEKWPDPYKLFGMLQIGTASDADDNDGTENWHDNIHNHLIGTK